MHHDVKKIADWLSAKTNAYHEIWLNGEPIQLADGHIEGYTVLVGGGMVRLAVDQATYQRLGSPLCYVSRNEAVDALFDTCVAIVSIERDFGNRSNRRFARMNYLIDKRGL